jgi:hypothetical protein
VNPEQELKGTSVSQNSQTGMSVLRLTGQGGFP